MIKQPVKAFLLILMITAFSISNAQGQEITVAIAANMQPVMKDLKADFKTRTQKDIKVISGSSGNLATQIRHGAPYDVFLSADTSFPQALQKDGFTVKKTAVYARGVLILCSTQNISFTNWDKLLLSGAIQKTAIGNPAIAPYGKAAQQLLTKAGIYNALKQKLVFGESITQVNTYITTGVVQAGFTTLSLIKDANNKVALYYKVMNPKDYAPIEQAMVILKHAGKNTTAEQFYRYMLSAPAKNILKAYGYNTL